MLHSILELCYHNERDKDDRSTGNLMLLNHLSKSQRTKHVIFRHRWFCHMHISYWPNFYPRNKQTHIFLFLSDNDMTVFIETDNSIVELSDVVLPRKGISYDARRRDNEVLTNR